VKWFVALTDHVLRSACRLLSASWARFSSTDLISRPGLVDAVIEGHAPTRLTVAVLTDDLPWDWNKQRRRFAVVLGANQTSQHPGSAPV